MERTSNKDNRSFIVKIDKKDNIIFANQDWFSFAEENGAAELQPASVKGQSLWEFICDAETVYLYQTLFTKTREQGKCIKIPFRCDSPDCRRLMRMDIIPCDHGEIMLKSHVVRIDPREYVHLLDATADRSDDFVRMCSYCKKIFIQDNSWYEVEQAIVILDLLATDKLPQITHTICPGCYNMLMELETL